MAECHFCGDTFSDGVSLHMHWEENHLSELNEHQRDELERSKQKQKRQRKQTGGPSIDLQKRKKMGGYALAAIIALGLIFAVGQHVEFDASGPTGQIAADTDFNLDDRPFLGDEDAPVTVIEFGDFLCPACGQFEHQMYPQLKSRYIDTGEVKFYYLHFPVVDHRLSVQAAAAAECVAEQDDDAFFEFKNAVFEQQQTASQHDWARTDFYTDIAAQRTPGVDMDELASCINSGETTDQVQADGALAQDIGATGTPTIVVDDQMVTSLRSFRDIENAIMAAQ